MNARVRLVGRHWSLCCLFLPYAAAAVVTRCGTHAAVAHAPVNAGEDATQQLDAIRLRCMQLLQPHVEAYIWQHEPLNLQSSVHQQPPWMLRHRGEASSRCNPLSGSIQLGGLSTDRPWRVCVCVHMLQARGTRTSSSPRSGRRRQSSSSSSSPSCGVWCGTRTVWRTSGLWCGCCCCSLGSCPAAVHAAGTMMGSSSSLR